MSIYTLKEINEMIHNIQQLIQDGADEEQIQVAMDAEEVINLERDVKLESYAMVIKNLENENIGLKAERDRFDHRIKHNNNVIERMKSVMAETLNLVEPDNNGNKRVKTEKFTFGFRKSIKVEVSDIDSIPTQYVKVERTISRSELAKALKAGEHIEGAKLVENQSLSIR